MSKHDDTYQEQAEDQVSQEAELSDEDLEDAAGGCWAPGPIIDPSPGPTFPPMPFIAVFSFLAHNALLLP